MKHTSSWIQLSMAVMVAIALQTPAVANAQGANPVGFGLFAGGSIPIGDFGNIGGTGWHAGGLVDWKSPLFPVGIRGDLAYHKFGSKNNFTPELINGTLNIVWSFPTASESVFTPYLIGGGGFYNKRGSCTNCGNTVIVSETKGGINGGAGLSVPLSGFGSLIEARYHLIFDSQAATSKSSFIAISAGIIFR